jgi:hypothetical protein
VLPVGLPALWWGFGGALWLCALAGWGFPRVCADYLFTQQPVFGRWGSV